MRALCQFILTDMICMGLSDIREGTAKRINIDIKLVSTHESQRRELKKFGKRETIEIVSGEVHPKLEVCSDSPGLGYVASLFRRGVDRARVIDSNGN